MPANKKCSQPTNIMHKSLTTHSQDCPPTLLRSLRSLRAPASGSRMATGALWLNATTAPCALSCGYGRASAKRRNCALRAVTKTPLAAFSGYNRGFLPLALRMIIGGGSGQSGQTFFVGWRNDGGSPCGSGRHNCSRPTPPFPFPLPPSPLSPMLRPVFLACGVGCRLGRPSVGSVGGARGVFGSLWRFRPRKLGRGWYRFCPAACGAGDLPLRGYASALARRARSRSPCFFRGVFAPLSPSGLRGGNGTRLLQTPYSLCKRTEPVSACVYYKIDFLRQYAIPTLKQC